MRVLIAAVVELWAALASAAGKTSTVLEPTSQWVVDYADNNCRLIRMFGADKDRVRLVFEQVAPHSLMTVMLVGRFRLETDNNVLAFEPLANVQISRGQDLNAVASSDKVVFWPRRLGRGRWGLIPDALATQMRKDDPVGAEISPSAPFDARAPRVKWNDHNWSVEPEEQWQAEDAAFGARADEVTAVVLNPGRSGSISLHTGGLARPLQALEKCASDSLKDWGIDPAVESAVATGAHPVVEANTLFSADDYPRAALQSFKQDNLEVWLDIDAQGRIASCRVISDFASPEINDAICGMVRRKESFIPARTKDGTSVPDFYIQSFVFKLQ
jgi:hypothetical protein